MSDEATLEMFYMCDSREVSFGPRVVSSTYLGGVIHHMTAILEPRTMSDLQDKYKEANLYSCNDARDAEDNPPGCNEWPSEDTSTFLPHGFNC